MIAVMGGPEPIIIFDTSALNALFDDPEYGTLKAGIVTGYRTYLTETCVAEQVANENTAERSFRLDCMQRLLQNGCCILPFHEIVERLAREFVGDPIRFDWTRLNVRFRECEQELIRRSVTTDAVSQEQREQAFRASKQFNRIYQQASQAVRNQFTENVLSDRKEFIRFFRDGNGPTWGIGKGLFDKAIKEQSSEQTFKAFCDSCPPFRALLWALALSEYDRCVRDPNNGEASMKAGRVDTFMAAYLPYCSHFVTRDKLQRRLLAQVVEQAGLQTSVLSYPEFRKTLVPLESFIS